MRNILLPLLASAALAAQAAPPARVEIDWDLVRNGATVGRVAQRLEHGAGRYRLDESWQGTGVYALRGEIRRSSSGTVGRDGLRPGEFTDQRGGREPTRARFDWAHRSLTLTHRGKSTARPLPAHPADRLTQLYGFAFAPPGRAPVELDVTDGRSVSGQVWRVAGRERLKLPAGEFATLRLERDADGGARRMALWLAAERDHLPVRLLIVEADGTRIEQVATRIAAP